MKALSLYLTEVEVKDKYGDPECQISSVEIDSRKVGQKSLFIAIPGTRVDGHKFIDIAIQHGANAIICQDMPERKVAGICYVQVADARKAAGRIAHAFYDKPSASVRLIGITGTNGKTTVATLLYRLFRKMGIQCGLITTIENRIGEQIMEATHTTPDPVTLNALLAGMRDAGCGFAFMEVSSHALDQRRTSGIVFQGAVFTNITHDHLDYHKTFQAYIEAKKILFDGLGAHAFALVNADDPRALYMVQNTTAKVSKYSLERLADYKAKIISSGFEGLELDIGGLHFHSRLAGRFNAYNLLAAYGVAMELGLEQEEVITALSDLKPAEGRFDLIQHPENRSCAIVDYAHTPDALQKVMSTIQHIKRKDQRLIVVVGCGGDRDRQKRPKMARIAASLADVVVLTSDNPRSEDPDQILDDMISGLSEEQRKATLRITDRKEAIHAAIMMAVPDDVVLIAGKGHEKYQEINGQRLPFDDKYIAGKVLLKDI